MDSTPAVLAILVAVIASTASFIWERLSRFISERVATLSTKTIDSALVRAKTEGKAEIPPEVIRRFPK